MAVLTKTPVAPAGAPVVRGGLAQSARDSIVMTRRNLIRMMRIPEMIIFGMIQPVMFVLMFAYVFGGAIGIPGVEDKNAYRDYVMAGIFAQTVTFATAGAGAGIAEDMHKGLMDRFRSLPMSRGAVLTGRTIADAVQTALTMVVMVMCALIVGWRMHDGLLKGLGGLALLLLLGYAFSWIGALIGLSVRTPEAATSGGLIWLFPLSFLSIAFAPPTTLPTFLQHIAYWNPFSATVQAARVLFGTPGADAVSDAWPMQHPVWASLLWSVVIIGIFRTWSVRKYRSAVS
ncbi:ABC transporter permease [Embleya sp. NPDC005575]|uniref:ABC transporter permease n=1 Tax=Embleya sp. NPDC005575 TaxID=3156892 RepID=UPI0033BB4D55